MRTHGTNSCYSSGCRCRPCKDAHAAYSQNRRRGWHRRVPAEPFAKQLEQLTRPVVTVAELSRLSGVPVETIRRIRGHDYRALNDSTAARLRPFLFEEGRRA